MISLSWEIYFKVEQGWLCFPPIDHMLRDTRYQATDVFWNISLRKHPPGGLGKPIHGLTLVSKDV